MKAKLDPLPYAMDALEPHISARTLEFHYGKHHAGYYNKLEKLVAGTPDENKDLVDIIRGSSGPVYNNAAQVWNHTFYWRCMKPGGGGDPKGRIGAAIQGAFQSTDEFKKRFVDTSLALFGSGYVWVYLERGTGKLVLASMKDADSPLIKEAVPVLGFDMWEHAYYLDRQNDKETYIRTFLDQLVNWEFAEENLTAHV